MKTAVYGVIIGTFGGFLFGMIIGVILGTFIELPFGIISGALYGGSAGTIGGAITGIIYRVISGKNSGLRAVIFILTFIGFIVFVNIFFEGVRILNIHTVVTKAARETARYAVIGEPLIEDSINFNKSTLVGWRYPKAQRLIAIQNKAIEEMSDKTYTKAVFNTVAKDDYDYYLQDGSICRDCGGVLGVSIDGQNSNCDFISGDPGQPGYKLRVTIYYNVPIWNPVYRVFFSENYVRVWASRILQNEGAGGLREACPLTRP